MKSPTDKKRYMDHCKLLWHMDRVIAHYDKGERVVPVHIDCGLTKKCQEKCVYCYGYYQTMSGAMIRPDALLNNLVASAAKIGIRSMAFIGDGEPSLNPAYWEALRLGKKLGLSMSTSTNGILVSTDYKRASILESCEWMRFNLSAVSQEGFRKIHGLACRDLVLRNIKDFIEYKHRRNLECDVGLQMVFHPDMMKDEVIPEAQFAIDSGVDYFVIKQCSIPDEGESGIATFDVNIYDSSEIIALLKKAEAMSTERTDIVPKWNIINLKGEKKYEHCVGVQLLPEVSGDGGVYPCAYFFGGVRPDLCYGNLHDKTLEEIIFSNEYWHIVKYMNEEFDPRIDCKGCCRQDKTNEFIWEYLHPPKGKNFI